MRNLRRATANRVGELLEEDTGRTLSLFIEIRLIRRQEIGLTMRALGIQRQIVPANTAPSGIGGFDSAGKSG
jgi:hypothetical protein